MLYGFAKSELSKALEMYRTMEEEATRPGADVVLVSVDDLKTIRRAYPNYFADTTEFLKVVAQATKEPSDGPTRQASR